MALICHEVIVADFDGTHAATVLYRTVIKPFVHDFDQNCESLNKLVASSYHKYTDDCARPKRAGETAVPTILRT